MINMFGYIGRSVEQAATDAMLLTLMRACGPNVHLYCAPTNDMCVGRSTDGTTEFDAYLEKTVRRMGFDWDACLKELQTNGPFNNAIVGQIGCNADEGRRCVWLFSSEGGGSSNLVVMDLRQSLGQIWFAPTPALLRQAINDTPEFKKHVPGDSMIIEFPMRHVWRLEMPAPKEPLPESEVAPVTDWHVKKWRTNPVYEPPVKPPVLKVEVPPGVTTAPSHPSDAMDDTRCTREHPFGPPRRSTVSA